MLSGTTLWELIEARVDETPGALLAVDEEMRTMTFAEFAVEAERSAAGLAVYGVGAGTVVTWQLPTWLESLVLVAALSRLGAVQNPVLPIYREREVGFITRQAGSGLIVVPSVWKGFDYEEMATGIARANGGCQVLVADRALPQGDPSTLTPLAVVDDDPVSWLFYTSGTTADPKGAMHTDAPIAAVAGHVPTSGGEQPGPCRTRVPVHPHRRNHLVVLRPADGVLAHPHGVVPPDRDARGPVEGERHARRLGNALPHGVSRCAAGVAPPDLPRRPGLPRRWCSEAAAARP